MELRAGPQVGVFTQPAILPRRLLHSVLSHRFPGQSTENRADVCLSSAVGKKKKKKQSRQFQAVNLCVATSERDLYDEPKTTSNAVCKFQRLKRKFTGPPQNLSFLEPPKIPSGKGG